MARPEGEKKSRAGERPREGLVGSMSEDLTCLALAHTWMKKYDKELLKDMKMELLT